MDILDQMQPIGLDDMKAVKLMSRVDQKYMAPASQLEELLERIADGYFVQHIEDRQPTASPAETGGRSAILCQLCNMSYVYDTGFDWDPETNDFAGENKMGIPLKRDFCRNGWEVRV